VSIGDTASRRRLLVGGDRDRVLERERVLRRDGVRGRSAAASVWTSLTKSTARGATMSRVASWPDVASSGARAGCRAEDRGQGEDQDPGRDRQARDRPAREAGGASGGGSAWLVTVLGLSASRRRGGEIGLGQRLDDELADVLAVGRPRVRGASQPMTLPMSRATRRRSRRSPRDERGDLGLGQGLRQVLAEDRDLGLFLVGEVLAAAGTEGLDRLAAGLDLAAQDGRYSSSVRGVPCFFSTL
jgi:hypothetical protein